MHENARGPWCAVVVARGQEGVEVKIASLEIVVRKGGNGKIIPLQRIIRPGDTRKVCAVGFRWLFISIF